MAFESMTYESILKRMIDRVHFKYPQLDTREGSLLFNAFAPSSLEMAILYINLDYVLRESFVRTASREYLLIACDQMGMDITAFDASAGTHTGVFDKEVSIGSRWNCDLYNYTVTKFVGTDGTYFTYELKCETVGTAPNNHTGTLTPITELVTGLTHAELTECIIEGENETSDDDIRTAYFDYIRDTATDGNVNQYKLWCANYDGIGNYKILPLWNGANTVKVSILSASNGVASETLIEEFQNYLDPGITGMGDGIAPIGAFVTVSTATEVPITISANIKLTGGYDISVVNEQLKKYFSEIAYEKSVVSYMSVGAEILKTTGVEYVSDLRINGVTSDIILGEEEIPVFNNATWTVI